MTPRPLLCAALCMTACINEDLRLYAVQLRGEVLVAVGVAAGEVHVELHHARTGVGVLATPLGEIETRTFAGPGMLEWIALVPLDEGEGLVVYAWLDRDGDGLLCGLGAEPEPAGVVVLTEFPAHEIDFSLTLAEPCANASALYPP